MPGRPPREWFRRCAADVAAGGTADNPGAVCGATWQRKTPAQKRATVGAEDTSMPKKKKKKKGAHKKAAARKPKRKKAKKKAKHHRCSHCGHSSSHGASGCTHTSPGGLFCSCKHTGRG